MRHETKNPVKLAKWIWRAYLRTALIPILLMELVFLAIFFGINTAMRDRLFNFLQNAAQVQVSRVATLESAAIDHQLDSVRISTELYAAQIGKALKAEAQLKPADAARLQYTADGAYYTAADSGGAAVFYSGYIPVGPDQRQKVARVLTAQELMKDILGTNPLISSIYFNTCDSLNVIYPYVDVISQYAPQINVPAFNFYYEADKAHDPDRTQKWTEAYLDPAGHGWIASSIAPVYSGDFLEGVVGADITVSTITDQILSLEVPGGGYGMIVGSNGRILALPKGGEADWGLNELKGHTYSEAVRQDTFKPDNFDLSKMPAMSDFAQKLAANPNGFTTLTLSNERKLVTWDTISQTGWKFIIAVPEQIVYEKIDSVGAGVQKFGIAMAIGLILFFAYFLQLLYRRAGKMSRNLSRPIVELNQMVQSIGAGNYFQEIPEFDVEELRESSINVVNMGTRLGEINRSLLNVQQELKEKENYLQAVINSIDDAIVELDENGYITNLFINEKKDMPKAPSFTSIDSMFEHDKTARLLEALNKVVKTGTVETIETEVDVVSGKRWAQARLSLVSSDPVRVVVTARDITQRKEMEESISKARDAAEAASRAKSQFLSNMSHELRTPLNAVLGFAQILEMDPSAPLTGMQKECVDEIMKAGNHLLELINEVLDLARIEAGKARLSIEPVEILPVLEETLTIIIPTSEKYGIMVQAGNLACGNLYVRADKIKLKQILINLLSNAIKYNKPDGKVDFYCEPLGDKVRFHVVDTGIGIPESELEEIFKPFYRLSNAKNVVEGTGVGLAVVKQLTEMMGGSIHAESKEGDGSHFYIELPAAEEMTPWAEKSDVQEKALKEDRTLPANKKILYVEDNQANLRLVERIVEFMPNTVFIQAQTAGAGIELARKERPDIILMDINLPDMEGFEAFAKLQEYEETKGIPVIAVSSNAMERDIGRAMRMGFFDYITKPIKADTFYERIKCVFNNEQR
jgi:signal transduction histidine kinase/ActR/RegA family two-component response regulator